MTSLSDGKAWFLALVESALERTDYHAAYVSRVVSQSADGSLSVVPDSGKIPPMTDVPIRYGVPGVSVKVSPGARVLVGFDGGDRRFPIATVWESAAVTELRVTCSTKVILDCPDVNLGNEAGAPIARLGDVVEVLFPPTAILAGVLGVPPATQPITGTLTIVDSLVGIITSGATRAKAS